MRCMQASRRSLAVDENLFDHGKKHDSGRNSTTPGFAGWRARTHLNSPEYMDEFLVFLGASYFRAIPKDAPYGLSARGLSINSGLPGVPGEFPDFSEFHLEKPAKDSKSLKAWALLYRSERGGCLSVHGHSWSGNSHRHRGGDHAAQPGPAARAGSVSL